VHGGGARTADWFGGNRGKVVSVAAISPTALFAHQGKISPEGAVTFGWLMLALSGLLATALIVARIRSGRRPYLGGMAGAVPFGLLACGCFGFAAACQQGADPKAIWRVVVAFPAGLGVLLLLYRWWNGRAEPGPAPGRRGR
jgi:hypothetical protein